MEVFNIPSGMLDDKSGTDVMFGSDAIFKIQE